MEKIGIFCSASDNIDKMYFESARRIGEWIGQTGKTLIYGGANLGLMECVARTVKENGGVTGRYPPGKCALCKTLYSGNDGNIASTSRCDIRDEHPL